MSRISNRAPKHVIRFTFFSSSVQKQPTGRHHIILKRAAADTNLPTNDLTRDGRVRSIKWQSLPFYGSSHTVAGRIGETNQYAETG